MALMTLIALTTTAPEAVSILRRSTAFREQALKPLDGTVSAAEPRSREEHDGAGEGSAQQDVVLGIAQFP